MKRVNDGMEMDKPILFSFEFGLKYYEEMKMMGDYLDL